MTKRKRLIGFFQELPHGFPQGGSLKASVGLPASTDFVDAARYLRAGTILSLTMGPAQDVLDGQGKLIAPPHLLTDGEWIWPLDLAHYVERYRVPLPPQFVQRMRSFDWVPPVVNESDLFLPALADCDFWRCDGVDTQPEWESLQTQDVP